MRTTRATDQSQAISFADIFFLVLLLSSSSPLSLYIFLLLLLTSHLACPRSLLVLQSGALALFSAFSLTSSSSSSSTSSSSSLSSTSLLKLCHSYEKAITSPPVLLNETKAPLAYSS
eukprot:TRINITY_DN12018_c1_g5_i1.p1 TRINITY_DN12018_c1_g5~~TRINITY_DN12018_c1_g5_i1.p1  ORF type:complete len:117 (+),score=26.56 TRINITY_DN12018_c1_g5_i1:133-483(+)